jgi:hypothetical protein
VLALSPKTILGRLLDQVKDDGPLVEELYLRTLSRQPTDAELKTTLAYFKTTNNRSVVLEDLFWALLNSSEFSHRR